MNFTAIDFETSTSSPRSICQVGLVRVENFKIVKELNILVQPPDNAYNYYNTKIHGISAKTTEKAPFFDEIWEEIEPYINNQSLVAHAKKFEDQCIKETCKLYSLTVPKYDIYCTFNIYGRGLDKLCKEFDIPLQHHDALSDARGCAELFMKYLREK
jgi:DNA polymerase III subunit epsilon